MKTIDDAQLNKIANCLFEIRVSLASIEGISAFVDALIHESQITEARKERGLLLLSRIDCRVNSVQKKIAELQNIFELEETK